MTGRFKIEWLDGTPVEEIEADKWTDEGLWVDFHLAYFPSGSQKWAWEQVLRVRADNVRRIERTESSDRSGT